MMNAEGDILFERRGARAHVTLNRPDVLNAVSHSMVLRLEEKLHEWAEDDSIAVVTIAGAGGRAFAAGGDIRTLHAEGRKDGSRNYRFYADEYRVNTLVKRFPKPYIALIDGIVMGGGVGLSVHGSIRIAGPATMFAMPETGIGLFPDVGGSYFLPRLPGEIGMYLGLTGVRLGAADCLYSGIAQLHCDSEISGAALASLNSMEWEGDRARADAEAEQRLRRFGCPSGEGRLATSRDAIDRCFSAPDLEGVFARLQEESGEWTERALREMSRKSPTSLHLAFRQLREGASLSFEDCMRMEYRLARACMDGHDFYEGVRAVILDKDGAPRWDPPSLDHVDSEAIDRAFSSLGADELRL